MKSNFNFLVLTSLSFLFLTACSQTTNYSMSVTAQPSTSAYSGAAFVTQPVFTVSPDSGIVTTQGDNVTLTPYFDSACTQGADGQVFATQNPKSLVNAIATFAGAGYNTPPHLEEKIYLKASGFATNATACTAAISIFQHFNAGVGNVVSGVTGVAGGTAAGEVDQATAVTVDPQFKIVVAGSSKNASGGTQLVVWRYYGDGSLDPNFGGGLGYTVASTTGAAGATGASESDIAKSVQVDKKGNIVVAGTSVNAGGGVELSVWRFTTAGILDTTFGSGTGNVVFGTTGAAGATAASELDSVSAMKLDSSGNIVVVGSSKNVGGGTEAAIWRYTSAGVLDTTFATTGYVHSGTTGAAGGTAGSEADSATALHFDASGNLVVAGSSVNAGGGTEVALWRYLKAGTLDATFGTAGVTVTGTTGAAGAAAGAELDRAAGVQIDSQSRVVVAGNSKNAGGGNELAIWRFTTAGALDTGFNTTGFAVSGTTGAAGAAAGSENDTVTGFKLDPSGNFVISGSSVNGAGGSEAAVWRYLPAGTLDTSFATVGYAVFGATGAAGATGASEVDKVNGIYVDANGRVLLGGVSANTAGGQELSLWRYTASGALDI